MSSYKMNTEYFSGSQASIFIGDVWVDDILDWQCSLGANAMPIYGYGSTFYDHACQGRVLAQGSFTINFREPNYLFAILARYRKYNGFFDPKEQEVLPSNPYSVEKDLKELKYQDKRRALDDFFFSNKGATDDRGIITTELFMGNSGSNSLSTLNNTNSNEFAIPTFDIKIGYGSTIDQDTIGEQIVGVKLVGKGKVIMANGEPIKESYSFFARNVI